MPRIQNQVVLCTEYWSGVKSADGRISAPTMARALAGFTRYTRSKYRPTNGRNGTAAMPERVRIRPREIRWCTWRLSFR